VPDILHYCLPFTLSFDLRQLDSKPFQSSLPPEVPFCISLQHQSYQHWGGGHFCHFHGVNKNVLDIVRWDVYDTYISAIGTVPVFHYTKRFIITRKAVNRGHLHGPKTTDTFRIIACNSKVQYFIKGKVSISKQKNRHTSDLGSDLEACEWQSIVTPREQKAPSF